MSFGIYDILQVLGALAVFIYGMKLMSEGIQRAAGTQLKNILRTMTKNRVFGVTTGFLTTGLVQSSSATTVMIVSFVNAGLLTLVEAATVIMGANVGTTTTGFILLVGLKFNLENASLPLFALGLPMLLSNNPRFKHWGEFVLGFSILMLGLGFLRVALPDLENNSQWLSFVDQFTNWGFFSHLLFVIIGFLITLVVQSSSAFMAITLTMCLNGWLTLDIAAAMILGGNVGTTITAQVASLVGNANAKRAAWFHTLFNCFGVLWMILILTFFLNNLILVLDFFGTVFNYKFDDPYIDSESMPLALAAFHSVFNIVNMLIVIWFIPYMVGLTKRIIKKDDAEANKVRLKFIDTAQKTPELATVELQKETMHFGEITRRMCTFTRMLLNATDEEEQKKMYAKLEKYEAITDKMEEEITEYITHLLNQQLTTQTSIRLRSFMSICNDFELIGDVYYQMYKILENKNKSKVYFTPKQRNGLNDIMDLVDEAFEIALENLNQPDNSIVSVSEASKKEEEINKKRDELRNYNLENLKKKGYNTTSAIVFTNMFSCMEKVGDHLINISEAVVGEI